MLMIKSVDEYSQERKYNTEDGGVQLRERKILTAQGFTFILKIGCPV